MPEPGRAAAWSLAHEQLRAVTSACDMAGANYANDPTRERAAHASAACAPDRLGPLIRQALDGNRFTHRDREFATEVARICPSAYEHLAGGYARAAEALARDDAKATADAQKFVTLAWLPVSGCWMNVGHLATRKLEPWPAYPPGGPDPWWKKKSRP